jgi:nucleoside-diphosphate-sugar epimerase
MRVLVAGASGVLGRQLLPLLQETGHEAVGFDRSGRPSPTGARVMKVDALDRDAVGAAVDEVKPDAVVHLMTAIPKQLNPKRLAAEFTLTNQLRTVGTRNLFEAAMRAGATRVIAQGLAYAYRPAGAEPLGEQAPFWTDGPKQFRPLVEALLEHERLTSVADGLVLRFGHLYGPGTAFAADGGFTQQVRAGKLPVVGGGTATFSFTHARDAARAVVAALDSDVTGALNVVDDDPAPVREWLPALARMLGAPVPKKAPAALARLAVGSWGVAYMTALPGADNTRAKQQLGWRPEFPSWREGLAADLRA